jgi:hypothetical protein
MKYTVVLLFFLIGCSDIRPSIKLKTGYFNLDSMRSSQVEVLSSQNLQLKKVVSIDDQSEEKSFEFDTSGWKKELEFIEKLDINKPRLSGVYEKNITSSGYSYIPKEGVDVSVKRIEMEYRNEELVKIFGVVEENNEIYSTYREINIGFKDKILDSYSIKGFQKIVLKDTTRFNIKGNIVGI